MNRAVVLVAILLVGCATVDDLSRSAPFATQVGQTLSTQRVTYIYDFDAGETWKGLWDHTYKFGRADSAGEMNMTEVKPIATCPAGSQFELQRVLRVRSFDNPESIEARGRIMCGSQAYDVSYVWGQLDSIIDAPWESNQYDLRRTRKVDIDGT